MSAPALPRAGELLFSRFAVDTRHSLCSALSFLCLSLGVNVKVKEICRVCHNELGSFCNLPWVTWLQKVS